MKRIHMSSVLKCRKAHQKREGSKRSALLAFPARIIKSLVFFKSSSSSSSSVGGSKQAEKAQRSGTFCIGDVRLNDLLSGRAPTPLTLDDFRDYLVHVEHAPENLYFHFWLKDYTERYHAREASQESSDVKRPVESTRSRTRDALEILVNEPLSPGEKSRNLEADLDEYLEMALRTFLMGKPVQGGHSYLELELELNLTAQTKDQLKRISDVSGDPSIFEAVQKEVQDMLEESMRRWLMLAFGSGSRTCDQRPAPRERYFSLSAAERLDPITLGPHFPLRPTSHGLLVKQGLSQPLYEAKKFTLSSESDIERKGLEHEANISEVWRNTPNRSPCHTPSGSDLPRLESNLIPDQDGSTTSKSSLHPVNENFKNYKHQEIVESLQNSETKRSAIAAAFEGDSGFIDLGSHSKSESESELNNKLGILPKHSSYDAALPKIHDHEIKDANFLERVHSDQLVGQPAPKSDDSLLSLEFFMKNLQPLKLELDEKEEP
ncbi:hypothetical protein CROQUDRAFT_106118 [Cronartium quercuum f. sp. fusiforme G11]|uniref:RGS domain-containing protein n=1 Tax=Cronartium quercuum f. sp. fusiforme G11 TaxID=708437 RepID=A0A9P6TCZ7_9BASI|nr:hypothetical protein CROQUDRAFT_106118 [Cronartium quercuum f. sp. fusiforme G11]